MLHKYKGYFLTILSASLFGLSPLWVTIFKNGGGNSIMLALFRNVFFLPICALLIKRKGHSLFPKMSGKMALKIIVLSVFGSGATQVLLFASYRFMASGVCTTVHFVYPLFVFIIGAVFFGQRLDRHSVGCLAVCLVGLACFYPRGGQISAVGLALALLSGLTYAFYMVYMDKGFDSLSAVQLQFYVSAVNAVMVFVCCLAAGSFTLSLSPYAWLTGIAASQILGIGVVLCQIGVKAVGAQRASMLSTFEPITSLAAGVLLLNEHLDMTALLGAGIILFSVLLFNMPQKKTANAMSHTD